jgi:microcystin-dependent protein
MCYGQAVSRTTYALLFGAIGTTYGTGDGSLTFNIPDCRGRVVAGQDDMGGSSANRLTAPSTTGSINGDTLGAVGGEEAHTQTQAELATHTHIQNSHTHTTLRMTGVTDPGSEPGDAYNNSDLNGTTGATTATNQNTGSSTPFNIVQPTIIMNKIIYCGVG